MSDDRELLEIQQQLEEIMQRIGRTFNVEHPRCNDIYEDVGATHFAQIQNSEFKMIRGYLDIFKLHVHIKVLNCFFNFEFLTFNFEFECNEWRRCLLYRTSWL